CGSLTGDLRPGDVVVATEVRTPEGTVTKCAGAPLAAALRTMGIEPHLGPIVSLPHIVAGSEREALAATGAIAVDMESAWLAEGAAGRPFAVLRVVVDMAHRDLRM